MPSMVERWFALYPQLPIVNTYGATEASDDISHYIMNARPDTYTVPVLKRPIQHFGVHIVNEQLQLLPVGAKGEILLSGPAVGRGYLNDPERTAQSFLKGPLPGITSQQRVYRTGDLGRYLPDGTMEFLGRRDTQVKIRGHRIELGEISHALMRINGITNAVVIDYPEQQFLAAYYQSEQAFTSDLLTEALKAKLPYYMIPQYFLHVYRFPLTPNGKIDKNALPHPESAPAARTAPYVAPRNDIEARLTTLWQEILNREQIGVLDNFFTIGGHSLKAMKLMARIHQEFNVSIKLADLFNKATIEELAADIARKNWVKKGVEEKDNDLIEDKSFII